MHTILLETAAARRARGRLGAWAGGILGAMAAAERRRSDRVRLAALPDHMLADMGLTRDAVRGLRPSLD
jgi:hypothetical protein